MLRYALPLLAASALAVPAAAAEVQIQASGPVVELTVHEQVEAEPDIAEVSAGVSTQAPTAVEAMRQNAQQMTSVIERIKGLGIAERDIQTTGISLHPQYDYDQNSRQQVFRGYMVQNRVSVTLREIGETGEVLDALVSAGATDLSGPNFSIDDETAAKRQARDAAMERAQEQAMAYARLAGYANVRLLEINEALTQNPPMPYMRTMDVQESAAVSTPVQPGRVASGVTVTVTYEMVQ